MNRVSRHLRPLLISVVALLLTAGLALAAKPTNLGSGNTTGSEASGKTVPTVVADQADPDKANESDEDATTDETGEVEKTAETEATTDSAPNCQVDPNTATTEALAALNHGAIVCWAAHQVTPDGYANHGAFVSEWARKNHGADASANGAAQSASKAGKHGHSTTTTTTP